MSRFGVSRTIAAVALLGAATAAASACGGDDGGPARPRPGTTGTGTAGGDGGAGSGAGAGGAGGGGSGAGAGGAAPATCGNDVADPGEACDGPDLGIASCRSFGFDDGELRCSAACTVDTSGCSGDEGCQDGRDNDGDRLVDCADPDCSGACADMCAAPQDLSDPAFVTGDTSGHATVASACTLGSPGVAYTFTATTTGFLDIVLTPRTDARLAVVLRSACDDAASEIECSGFSAGTGVDTRLTVPVREGDSMYVVVTGADGDQAGPFELALRSRTTVCGDGIQDPTEECDNPLGQEGDGCSDECRLEPTEVEPNETVASATPYETPFYAAIAPAGDVDVVSVVVPQGPTVLIAETISVTTADCIGNRLDSTLEILDDSGDLLVRAHRGGTGQCARAVAPSLAAGTYHVRVTAGPGAALPTFPYRLDVTMIEEVCGDGDMTAGEQCDDGNTTAGDGCGPTCRFELDETEPNNTPAQANDHAAPWLAEIAPAGDVDVIAVSVPGPSSTLNVVVSDNGTGACMAGQLDSFIEILGSDGSTVLASDEDSGLGYCSFASVPDLAAGTYYVRVRAAQLVPDATFFYRLNVTLL
ncbi:pre-peptidase C-terminal domain-containing protein [Sorangium sp. So ce1036]|uniref:pre-peptidase C-terminal domain-containing protein n=1 Tax=Sorangium sp. So ce1036 TaxID=3133328 RepID=UPI003F04E673